MIIPKEEKEILPLFTKFTPKIRKLFSYIILNHKRTKNFTKFNILSTKINKILNSSFIHK